MFDTNADETVSRRSVLKTTGGLLAGSTALAGLGAGTAAADEERVQVELRELNEEYIAVEVYFPDGLFDEVEFPDDLFLGHADRFVIHEEEDMVSLPEEREEIVNPVEVKRFDEGACRMYFANDGDPFGLLENPEEVTLGLGFFPWLTIQSKYWDKPRVGGMG